VTRDKLSVISDADVRYSSIFGDDATDAFATSGLCDIDGFEADAQPDHASREHSRRFSLPSDLGSIIFDGSPENCHNF
jgi:hypothetical protein